MGGLNSNYTKLKRKLVYCQGQGGDWRKFPRLSHRKKKR